MATDPPVFRAAPHITAIIVALVVAIAPHVFRLPPTIVIWCAGLWGYAIHAARHHRRPPSATIRLGMTVLGAGLVLFSFGREIGPNAYVGLMAVMAGLKPLEMRTHRDRTVTLFLAYFIVITSLFTYENLAMTLYMALSVLLTTAILVRINHPEGSPSGHFRLAGRMMAQAIPLTLILFFLFPRIQGSLWGVPRDTAGRTGFSDTLSPGNVTSLVQSEEIAFRAEFREEIPPRRDRYFRGIVYHDFDGRAWRWRFRASLPLSEINGNDRYDYTISLEPHEERWLFSLELPAAAPDGARMFADHTLFYRSRVRKKLGYRLTSYTDAETGLRIGRKSVELALPPDGNPRTRDLARRWADELVTPETIVERALTHFRENEFYYTLNPPRLGDDPIDRFLFETRRGYCEHYASAFAVLMRAAGVPARVVGGYQGGDVNTYGNYLVVRQSDAHAWAEVWLAGRGWVRVDPTAAVSPARIEQGVAASVSADELPAFLRSVREGSLRSYFDAARDGWDWLSTRWDILFAGYSFEQQRAVLERLGIDVRSWRGPAQALLLALLGVGLLAGLYGVVIFRRRGPKAAPAVAAYRRFCEKLARVGLPRPPAMGPADYAVHVAAARPDLKGETDEIIDRYIRIRYGAGGDEAALARRVREFKPGRKD